MWVIWIRACHGTRCQTGLYGVFRVTGLSYFLFPAFTYGPLAGRRDGYEWRGALRREDCQAGDKQDGVHPQGEFCT